MKYLFLFSEKVYKLIAWEWYFLKKIRRKKRKNILLRSFIAILFLLSIIFLVVLPPFLFGFIFNEGIKFSIFFIWIWILNLKFF